MPSPPIQPMLASVTDGIPRGAEWAHEVKWDGMRILADIHDGSLVLSSRTGRDVSVSYPELAGLADTYDDALLDGEVVALDGGVPSFGALAERMHVGSARKAAQLAATRPVTFMVFDLLRLFGQDLTKQPWSARRELLERLDLRSSAWQVPPVYEDGEELFDATREQGLEGIVSKRRSSVYTPGRRSPDWRKSPHRASLSVVIGGWRPEVGTTNRLGAVLVGTTDGAGGFSYAGRVGAGLAGTAGLRLGKMLEPLSRKGSPFTNEVPREDADGAFWVEPTTIIEVQSLGRGSTGKLRQPAYLGLRSDLTPDDLHEVTDG